MSRHASAGICSVFCVSCGCELRFGGKRSVSTSEEMLEATTDTNVVSASLTQMEPEAVFNTTETFTENTFLPAAHLGLFSTESTRVASTALERGKSRVEDVWATRTLNNTPENVDVQDNLVWNLLADGEMDLGLLAASLGILFVTVVLVSLYFMLRSRRDYRRIPGASDAQEYEYIYKPLAGNSLDEEYENTFVGVSIPLIQENSKV